MTPHHHDLILEICSGNLGDDVESRHYFREFNFEIHLNRNLLSLLDHSHHAIVVFCGDGDLRQDFWYIRTVWTYPSAKEVIKALWGTWNAGLCHEDGSAIATGAIKKCSGSLIHAEFQLLCLELSLREKTSNRRRVTHLTTATPTGGTGHSGIGKIKERRISQTVSLSSRMSRQFTLFRCQHERIFEFPFVFGKIRFVLSIKNHCFTANRAFRARAPCFWIGDHRIRTGRNNIRREFLQCPSFSGGVEICVMNILQSPFLQLAACPFGSFPLLGRPCEPGPIHVGKITEDLHNLRPVHPLILDHAYCCRVEFLGHHLAESQRSNGNDKDQQNH